MCVCVYALPAGETSSAYIIPACGYAQNDALWLWNQAVMVIQVEVLPGCSMLNITKHTPCLGLPGSLLFHAAGTCQDHIHMLARGEPLRGDKQVHVIVPLDDF